MPLDEGKSDTSGETSLKISSTSLEPELNPKHQRFGKTRL
jgi:hypothetical protein